MKRDEVRAHIMRWQQRVKKNSYPVQGIPIRQLADRENRLSATSNLAPRQIIASSR